MTSDGLMKSKQTKREYLNEQTEWEKEFLFICD